MNHIPDGTKTQLKADWANPIGGNNSCRRAKPQMLCKNR